MASEEPDTIVAKPVKTRADNFGSSPRNVPGLTVVRPVRSSDSQALIKNRLREVNAIYSAITILYENVKRNNALIARLRDISKVMQNALRNPESIAGKIAINSVRKELKEILKSGEFKTTKAQKATIGNLVERLDVREPLTLVGSVAQPGTTPIHSRPGSFSSFSITGITL